jgi:ABC-type sugar transport system substrate-binding protein
MFTSKKASALGVALLATAAVAAEGLGSASAASQKKVAFIAVFPSNPYVASAYNAAAATAAKYGVKLTEIGVASADPQAEYSAIQDAATQNAYDGYIILPQNGTSDLPAAEQLVKTGKPVVADGIALGPNLCTDKPQISGMAGAAITPTCDIASQGFQSATMAACKGLARCTILWETGLLGFAGENEFLGGVKAAVKQIKGAKLVISSQTMYDPNTARNVITNALNANKSINVVWAQAPQMYLGTIPALKAANRTGVRIVTDGNTPPQLAALKAGQVNGNPVVSAVIGNSLPATDSVYSMQIMAKALTSASYRNVAINTLRKTGYPMVWTKSNISRWKSFTPQWSAGNVLQ